MRPIDGDKLHEAIAPDDEFDPSTKWYSWVQNLIAMGRFDLGTCKKCNHEEADGSCSEWSDGRYDVRERVRYCGLYEPKERKDAD